MTTLNIDFIDSFKVNTGKKQRRTSVELTMLDCLLIQQLDIRRPLTEHLRSILALATPLEYHTLGPVAIVLTKTYAAYGMIRPVVQEDYFKDSEFDAHFRKIYTAFLLAKEKYAGTGSDNETGVDFDNASFLELWESLHGNLPIRYKLKASARERVLAVLAEVNHRTGGNSDAMNKAQSIIPPEFFEEVKPSKRLTLSKTFIEFHCLS